MSLRVWLPLTKDLRNQGLDDIPSFQLISGNSFITGGKIGEKAFNITKQQRILSNTSCMTGKKQMSYAYWVKVNTVWTTKWLDGIAWYSTDGTSASYSRQEFYNNCTKVGTWFKGSPSSLSGYDFNPEEWTHIAATFNYNTGEVKFYLNGELKGTSNSLSTSDYCRGDFYIGDTGLDILENDVRIYDHCLSPLEVKHISQGLVLHYPLNRNGWGNENLLLKQINSNSWSNWNSGNNTWVSENIREKIVIDNKVWAHVHQLSASSYGGYSIEPSQNGIIIDSTKQYTWSCLAKAGNDTNAEIILWYHWRSTEGGANLSQNSKKFILSSNPVRISWTLPQYINNTYNVNRINLMMGTSGTANNEIYFTDVKFEEGSIATPWCPNSADALATTMGLNDNVEYDTSGYCNNGEYYSYDSLGSIEYDSDSPRYNVCTFINSDNNTTDTASGTKYLYGHCGLTHPTEMTVSFWCKPLGGYNGGANQGQFCTTNIEYGNINAGYDYLESAMNHRDGWVDMNDSSSTSQCHPEITFIPNEWHYYTFTYDGQNGKSYRDGLLQNTKSFSKPKTLDSFIGVILGFSKAGGVWRSNKSYYSDFRIYVTALSVEDIKDLYNLGASIDSNNNLLIYELNEE